MSWVSVEDVSAVVHIDLEDDEWILHDIDHVQALCVVEIGEPEEPITAKLKAVVAQITARIWRAGESARTNPQGDQQETLGAYSHTMPPGAGLGLTNAEKKLLRKAAGLSSTIGVLRMTRGPLETAGPLGIPGSGSAWAIDWFETDP